ncbi:MAG: YdcH family protein [Alphaproteobacteria bacterium]
MTQTASVETLKSQHAILEAKLDEEEHRPLPDEGVNKEIKREKLRIKDQIASLENA